MKQALAVESLPGVGPHLAAAIRRTFRTDEAFLDALRRCDLQALQRVEGISPRRAVELVRHITGHGDDEAFLATPSARRVADNILNKLRACAATQHGRNRLALLGPLPDEAAAHQRMAHVMAQADVARDLDVDAVVTALAHVRDPVAPKPVCDTTRLVVAGSEQAHDRLFDLGVGMWCQLGTPRDAAQADADLVILAYDDRSPDLPADAEVPAGAPLHQLAPQALLAWVEANRSLVQACQDLAELTGRTSVAPKLLEAVAQVPATKIDERSLVAAVDREQAALDARLEQRLEGLRLSAADMMRAMTTKALPPALKQVIDEERRRAQEALRAATGISFQPFEATFPATLDDDEVERVLRDQRGLQEAHRFAAAQQAAAIIAKHQDALRAEAAAWLEFDADLALGRFALRHGLRTPTFGDHLAFSDSVHLDLAHDPSTQRIAYHLGRDTRRAVLTGANSGGKSTLLEHVAQVVIMARFGLPVVGDATVPWMDEVHLVTARRGLDAGAFETFLQGFLPIAQGDAKRLVLADEVESVTELEAAGRILAFFLDRLAQTQSLCVLVTHMAQPILAHVREPVRVDGIEATGLDDQDRLIVDRCPKIGLMARSTPELIVQRLVHTTTGERRALFEALHACLIDQETGK